MFKDCLSEMTESWQVGKSSVIISQFDNASAYDVYLFMRLAWQGGPDLICPTRTACLGCMGPWVAQRAMLALHSLECGANWLQI